MNHNVKKAMKRLIDAHANLGRAIDAASEREKKPKRKTKLVAVKLPADLVRHVRKQGAECEQTLTAWATLLLGTQALKFDGDEDAQINATERWYADVVFKC